MKWQAIGFGAFLGLLIPLVILILDFTLPGGFWPEWVWWLWPSSYMLIATAGTMTALSYKIIAASIATNILVYSLLALLAWQFWVHVVRKELTSK